jgi:hypothetical protein
MCLSRMFCWFIFLIDENLNYIIILSLNFYVFNQTYFNLDEKLSDDYKLLHTIKTKQILKSGI